MVNLYFNVSYKDLSDDKQLEVYERVRIEILEQVKEMGDLPMIPNGLDDYEVDADAINDMVDRKTQDVIDNFVGELWVSDDSGF